MTQVEIISATQSSPQTVSFDPASIAESESPAALVLAISVLLSVVFSGIIGLVQTILLSRLEYRDSDSNKTHN